MFTNIAYIINFPNNVINKICLDNLKNGQTGRGTFRVGMSSR
jgi:hypothetical protein